MTWTIEPSDEYFRRHKHYAKKHPKELQAVLVNLDFYLEALNSGTPPLQIESGFIHKEPQGVVAIDQKGGGKNLAQTRLYVFAEVETQTLHIITLGDKKSKKSQQEDLRTCKNYVESLRKARDKAQLQSAEDSEVKDSHEEEIPERRGDGPGDVGEQGAF